MDTKSIVICERCGKPDVRNLRDMIWAAAFVEEVNCDRRSTAMSGADSAVEVFDKALAEMIEA